MKMLGMLGSSLQKVTPSSWMLELHIHHPCRCTIAFTPPLIHFFSDYLLQEWLFGITQGFCMFHAAIILESKIVTFLRRFLNSAGILQDGIKMEQSPPTGSL